VRDVRVDILGQAEYFFWPSESRVDVRGSLNFRMLDRSSLTIYQASRHLCSHVNAPVSERVVLFTEGLTSVQLITSAVAYICIANQGHKCCIGNKCLTLSPRAPTVGSTAIGSAQLVSASS